MNILVCQRVANLPSPKKGRVRGHYCENCQEEIWVIVKEEDAVILPATYAHLPPDELQKELEKCVRRP